MTERTQVVVVGAGPVGLSAAVRLASLGIACICLEKRETLGTASKASTFHAPTLEVFREFGIVNRMLAMGLRADRIQYRMSDGEVAAQFDHALLAGDTDYPFRLHLEQSQITPLLADALAASGLGSLRLNCEVTEVDPGTEAEAGSAVVTYRDGAGVEHRIRADFVLGADGAHSRVREALGLGLDGVEYPGRVMRLIVRDPLEQVLPDLGQITYVFNPAGGSISLLQMPDIWRVIVRLGEGFDPEQVVRPDWYMPVVVPFLPGIPPALDVVGTDIYGARKMLATDYGRGRAYLIGDALHLTNTRGGMNMNCGIHDAYAVGGAIAGALLRNEAPLATAAARARHLIARDELLPRTDGNIRAGLDRVAQMRATAADPVAARSMLLRSSMLDMAPARDGSARLSPIVERNPA